MQIEIVGFAAAAAIAAALGYLLPRRPFLTIGLVVGIAFAVGWLLTGGLMTGSDFWQLGDRPRESGPASPAPAPEAESRPRAPSLPQPSKPRAPSSSPDLPAAPAAAEPRADLPDLPQTLTEFVNANRDAAFAFRAPREIRRGEIQTVVAELSIRKTVARLKEKLKKDAMESQQIGGDLVEVAQTMAATLSGLGFDISPEGPQEQVILVDAPTKWSWQVRGREEGVRKLRLRLEAILKVSTPRRLSPVTTVLFSKDMRRVIHVQDWDITVYVGTWSKFKETASDLANFVQKLWAVWLILVAVGSATISWMRKRRQAA